LNETFASVEEAFGVLANPEDPRWFQAFALLMRHPGSAPVVQEAFRETLEALGARSTGVDPTTGQAVFRVEDVARALGVPAEALEAAGEAGRRETVGDG
jgi:hypothetical protein